SPHHTHKRFLSKKEGFAVFQCSAISNMSYYFINFTIGKALKVPALIYTIIRKELFRSFVVESRSQQRHRESETTRAPL
ncbi:TPA: hypothetical protein ACK3JV_001737, partial [Streptococcus equi subsp. zooepidemicus]